MHKKNNTNKKTKTNEIVKPLLKDEVKKELKKVSTYNTHPETAYKKIWNTILNIRAWNKDDEWVKHLEEYMLKLDTFSYNHINLANAVPSSMCTSIIELANNLIEEYSCETTLEKTLCEIIANSYWKIMSVSESLKSSLDFKYFSNERNSFLNILSKELDRENRNYLTALNNLLEIKRPKMNIKVKTKNAYFSQTQQFNNNQVENEKIKD